MFDQKFDLQHECSVCYEAYDKQQRIPTVICINSHIICRRCCLGLSKNGVMDYKCPFCKLRVKFQYPLKRLIDYNQQHRKNSNKISFLQDKVKDYQSPWFKESIISQQLGMHTQMMETLVKENEQLRKEIKAKDDYLRFLEIDNQELRKEIERSKGVKNVLGAKNQYHSQVPSFMVERKLKKTKTEQNESQIFSKKSIESIESNVSRESKQSKQSQKSKESKESKEKKEKKESKQNQENQNISKRIENKQYEDNKQNFLDSRQIFSFTKNSFAELRKQFIAHISEEQQNQKNLFGVDIPFQLIATPSFKRLAFDTFLKPNLQ